MKTITLTVFLILLNYSVYSQSRHLVTENSINEIKKSKEISIQLKHIWGADDDNQIGDIYFKNPSGITIGSDEHIYITDSILDNIKVFTPEGKLLKIIGKSGQGPGDLRSPQNINFYKNTLMVYEYGNQRIQHLDKSGKSLSIYKINPGYLKVSLSKSYKVLGVPVFNDKNNLGKKIIDVYDTQKGSKQYFGRGIKMPNVGYNDVMKIDTITSARYLPDRDQYYLLYSCSQMVQIYNNKAKLLQTIHYQTPQNLSTITWNTKIKNYELRKKIRTELYPVDMTVDKNGTIYLVIQRRLKKKKEDYATLLLGDSKTDMPFHEDYPAKTDLYKLLVFSSTGKIIGHKILQHYCSSIKVQKDNLFIIDKAFEKVIYQYQLSL